MNIQRPVGRNKKRAMGIGSPVEGFECDIYLPRIQPAREWIIDICYTLWRHGLTFFAPHTLTLIGNWDEQLQIVQPYANTSLLDQIDEIVTAGYGSLFCYEHEVEIELNIDTDLRGVSSYLPFSSERKAMLERLSLSRLELFVKYPVINVDQRLAALPQQQVPAAAYLIPPYQQIHLTMTYWVEILCLKLQAAFAVGYYATNSYFPDEADFRCGFDLAMISALEHNQLPSLRDWFTSIYLLYAPAALRKLPQAEEWFCSPVMWERRLSNGGSLAYALPETLDEIRAKDFNSACDALLKQRDRAQLPLARIYLQRAQEIPMVSLGTRYATASLLEQVEYMEQHPDIFFA